MASAWRQRLLLLLAGFPLRVYRRVKGSGQRLRQWSREGLRAILPSGPRFGWAQGGFTASATHPTGKRPGGRIILRDQGAPSSSATSLVVQSGLHQHQEQPWPIFWKHFPAARLLGSSLALINNRQQICVEAAYGPQRFKTDPAYHHFTFGSPVYLGGNWTSIISRWVPTGSAGNFAHWLLDALPRLALLQEFPEDTRILVPQDLHPFQIQTLEWLGLAERCRPTAEKNVLLANYFFSSPVSMVVCYSPYAIEFLRANFLSRADQTLVTPKRFFLRRTGRIRNIVNETEVLAFFTARGWAIVDAATLSLAAQIQYFSQAEAICAIHGAGLTNCAWCHPGCKVIELLADQYLSGCFEWICEVVQANHQYQIFPSDSLYNARVDLKELDLILQKAGV